MFTPLLPGSSLSAWLYLKESRSDQLAAFSNDPMLTREASHFAEGITDMTSVSDLMGDYLSLKVALGAHGLQDDLPNRYFVQQVIEQGIEDDDAFANRLGDARYQALAQSFSDLGLTGTGDLTEQLKDLDAGLDAAVRATFGDSPMHLAAAGQLDSEFTLGLLGADTAERQWTRAAEDPALSAALEKILGTSASLSSLDAVGRGRVFAETAEYMFGQGTLSALIDADNTFALADAHLGTSGAALSDAFSYGGLAVAVADIFVANAEDGDRWAALQADTALRDVVATALGVSDGLDGLSAADQITALQDAAEAAFGTSGFDLFSSQVNLAAIGDAYLASGSAGPSDGFTLGGFVAAVTAVRDQGATVEETWESVLGLETLQASLMTAFGLPDSFADEPLETRIETLMAETETRFGSSSPAVYENDAVIAGLAGLIVEAHVSDITAAYMEQSFRIAVGEVRPELRVAMSVAEDLQLAVDKGGTDNGQWYRVLGSNVLREAFETAFGLDASFAQLDLDKQVSMLKEFSQRYFGTDTVAGFLDEDTSEALITRYLARSESTQTVNSPLTSLFSEASASTILATLYGAS